MFNGITRWRPRHSAPQHGAVGSSQGQARLQSGRPWKKVALSVAVGPEHYEVLGQVTRPWLELVVGARRLGSSI
uniref:Uncharacterized protein n=1 Tax=Knipowitschia caucasica TaxID=637954 RepID=A0AAV2JML3_KNICA